MKIPKTRQHKSEENCIIIFTRFPEAGHTKTRLIPLLGAEKAALLHKKMAEKIFKECAELSTGKKLRIEIHYHGGNRKKIEEWIPKSFRSYQQTTGSLGEKLYNAAARGFRSGSKKIVIIGTDCPLMNKKIIDRAFEQLDNSDIVIGPALDGGYYLIGLKDAQRELFKGIDWGTEKVFNQTIAKVQESNKTWFALPILSDIDLPEDLQLIEDSVLTKWLARYEKRRQ